MVIWCNIMHDRWLSHSTFIFNTIRSCLSCLTCLLLMSSASPLTETSPTLHPLFFSVLSWHSTIDQKRKQKLFLSLQRWLVVAWAASSHTFLCYFSGSAFMVRTPLLVKFKYCYGFFLSWVIYIFFCLMHFVMWLKIAHVGQDCRIYWMFAHREMTCIPWEMPAVFVSCVFANARRLRCTNDKCSCRPRNCHSNMLI